MTVKNYSEATVVHLAEEDYRSGEASFELEQCSAALIIIDMQREFVEAGLSKYWIPEATRHDTATGASAGGGANCQTACYPYCFRGNASIP